MPCHVNFHPQAPVLEAPGNWASALKPVCVCKQRTLSTHTHAIGSFQDDMIEFSLFLLDTAKVRKLSKSSRKSNKILQKDGLDIEKQQNYKIGLEKRKESYCLEGIKQKP